MAYVGSGTTASASSAATVAPSKSGSTAGNLLVIHLSWASATNSAVATPAGWKLGVSSSGNGSATNQWAGTSIFFQDNIAGGAVSAVTLTLPNSTSFAEATISEFSGYSTVVALNVTALNGGNTNVNTFSLGPTATTTVATALSLACFAQDENDTGTTNLNITTPTGYSSIFVNQDNTVNVGTRFSYKELTSTGTETTAYTWTSFTQSLNYADISIVILAAASAFVPVGASSTLQSQVAYREPSRLIQPARPTNTAGTTAVYVPVGAAAPLQAEIAYREQSRLVQPQPPKATVGTTAIYGGKPTTVIVQQQAWPYAQFEPPEFMPIAQPQPQVLQSSVPVPGLSPWPYATLQPASEYTQGITPQYCFSTPLVPVVEPLWPYAQSFSFPDFVAGTTPYTFAQAANPVVEPPWPYAQSITFPVFSGGIATQYVFNVPLVPVVEPPWPYAQTVTFPSYSSSVAQALVAPTPVITPVVEPAWPYAQSLTFAEFIAGAATPYTFAQAINPVALPPWPYAQTVVFPVFSAGITPSFVAPAAALTPIVEPLWPYANAQPIATNPPPTPAQFVPFQSTYIAATQPWPYAQQQITAQFLTGSVPQGPPTLIVVPLTTQAWPYTSLLQTSDASLFSQGPPPYAGAVQTISWPSWPRWPYVETMVPPPTASEWGQAPPPPPAVPPGSNALRRWVIQQYNAYFDERDKKTKLSKAEAKRAKAHQPRKAPTTFSVDHPPPDPDYLSAAFRLADQVAAGALSLEIRVKTLEQAKPLAFPKLPVPMPSERQVVDPYEGDDELLLLAILFNEGDGYGTR